MTIGGSKTLREYLDYWQIKQPVFQAPVNLDRLYIPERWSSYLERVMLFSGQTSSLIGISSPPGHCKSTVAKWIYHNLSVKTHEIILLSLFREEHEQGWLLPKLGKFFSIQETDQLLLVEKIADAIDEINREGRLVTIIIDEAHKIKDPEAFAELHGLISMQSLVSLGVNSILVGNQFLNEVINHTPDLKSRLNLSLTFSPLDIHEAAEYIYYTLDQTSINSEIFTGEAIETAFEKSGGIFSRLNALLENCLIEAFLKHQKAIDFKIVDQAARFLPSAQDEGANMTQNVSRPELVSKRTKEPSKSKSRRKTENEAKGQQSVELSSLFYKADDK